MRVIVYTPGLDNPEHHAVLSAFAEGIGPDTEIRSVNDYIESDIAVVFGVGKKNVPVSYARGAIIQAQQKAKKLVLVLEKGYVNRDVYYAAGWNGLNNRANFRNKNMPGDRWAQLGKEIVPWKKGGATLLVCGQVPSDASVQNIDIIEWCATTIYMLRRIAPNNEIVFRPHPLALDRTPSILHATRSQKSLQDDLTDARYVITYNSNIGVDAILAGVPIFAGDEGSMAYDLASKDLTRIIKPPLDTVTQWAHNLAYTQWTPDEMREGLPWKHLTRSGQ